VVEGSPRKLVALLSLGTDLGLGQPTRARHFADADPLWMSEVIGFDVVVFVVRECRAARRARRGTAVTAEEASRRSVDGYPTGAAARAPEPDLMVLGTQKITEIPTCLAPGICVSS
jgi:hypothetical protein